MKTSPLRAFTVVLLLLVFPGSAQTTDASKEIEKVIGDYFAAISERDTPAMRKVLAKQFVAMDTVTKGGNKSARIGYLDTAADEQILPPEGNKDMAGFRVSALKAEFSDSNPTAAIASFTISRALTEKQLEDFRRAIDPKVFTDAGVTVPKDYEVQRARIQKWVSEKHMQFSLLAMLGQQDGEWKIVCMSFP
ncbi:MAG: nuclear transport factor 2 family protein [Verrucomicrobia bacterium]|nr:nuclear transport factor 2 family protein [Verrucomicrobiota bacterium]